MEGGSSVNFNVHAESTPLEMEALIKLARSLKLKPVIHRADDNRILFVTIPNVNLYVTPTNSENKSVAVYDSTYSRTLYRVRGVTENDEG